MTMKTRTLFTGSTYRFLITFLMAGLFTMQVVSGQWLANWAHRVPVTIANTTGETLTDFQVELSLTTFAWANVKPDGSDIRFTNSGGQNTLPYWIESWSYGNSATIWVKVDQLLAGNTTIYLYYGNQAALSASNGFSTFDFFDDFEGGIDLQKWTQTSGITWTTPTVVQPNGSTGRVAQGYVATSNSNQALLSLGTNGFTGEDYITEVNARQTAGNCWGLCVRATAIDSYYMGTLYDNTYSAYNLYLYDWLPDPNGHPYERVALGNIATNQWYKMTVEVNSNYVSGSHVSNSVVVDVENLANDPDLNISYAAYSRHLSGGVGLYVQGTATAQFNDLRVRKFASTEPSVTSLGAEETAPPLNIEYTKTDVTCYGALDGTISVTVTNGTAPYTYEWTPGDMDTPTVENLAAGTYTVQVYDSEGGIGSQNITILQPDQIIPSYTITNPPVCASGMATVEISATGGTPPYSTGVGSFAQGVGTTEYTITDANGCQVTFPVTVNLAGAWFNSEWKYRKPLEISNPGGVALTDFQVKVTLDNTFNFDEINQGGSDIRFTTYDGIEAPYWIEDWDDTNNEATVWVKAPSIPVGGTQLYLYYGNETATSASDGTATFRLFDNFDNGTQVLGAWGGTVAHDWKYSMEMQQGALYYSMERAAKGWTTESMDIEIEDEFDYIHSQINQTTGVVTGLTSEPQYCYGVLLSNLALGALYFETINPTLATRCYDDMTLVYGYVRDTYGDVIGTSDGGASSMALLGFSNAWKAFNGYGNSSSAAEVKLIIEDYVDVFTTTQSVSGAWGGVSGVQEHLKRNFGVLTAYDVDPVNYTDFLTAVNENIDYVIGYFLQPNGGLTWHGSTDESFFECHQQWFMIAVRMLYNRNTAYDFRTEGALAWNFLTNTNYSGHDMYVHNYVNHNAFFSYRDVTSAGDFQVYNDWKGSYEVGAALWGMALNYDLVSSHISSYDNVTYNYLDEMVKHVKRPSSQNGFFSASGNWIRILNWTDAGYLPDPAIWTRIGTPGSQLVQVEGNNALRVTGNNSHDYHFISVDNSFDNFVFEARVLMTEDQNGYADPEIGFHYTDLLNRYFTQMRGTGVNDLYLRRVQGGNQYINLSRPYDYTQDLYFNYRMVINGNSIKLLINDDEVTDYMDNGSLLIGSIYIGNYATYPVYYDDVRIREFTAVEPVVTFTSEESAFTWTGCEATDVWTTGGNWYSGVAPGPTDDVIVMPADHYPVITGTIECASVTIEPEARMTVAAGGELTAGIITINTEGTASSGSLVNMGTVNGTVVFNRQLLLKASGGDFQLASSPVVVNSSANTEDILRAKSWNEVEGVWTNATVLEMVNGRGYNLKQTETGDGIVTYTGTVAAGDVGIDATCPFTDVYDGSDLAYDARTAYVNTTTSHSGKIRDASENWGGGGWNLLGNPYTSAINVTAFIDYNFGSSYLTSQFDPSYQALYIHDGATYDGLTPSYKFVAKPTGWEGFIGGDHISAENIQAGQGFFVLAMNDWSTFTFTRDMQVHDVDVPMLKSTESDNRWPGLQLMIKSGTEERTALIVYGEDMTAGLDPGFDIGQYGNYSGLGIYTTLAAKDNGVNFARQALPLADYKQNIIPVGIDCEAGGELVFSAITVPIGTYKFWLEDRLSGIYTDLTTKSYTVTLPAESWGTGRFYIIASANTPTGIENPNSDNSNLRMWMSNSKLIIKGEVGEKAQCELYDLNGKRILEHRLAGGDLNIVDIPAWLHGVFFARVTDGIKVKTQKLVLP